MKWEYMVRVSPALPTDAEGGDEMAAALNSVGEEGWELISVVVGSLEGAYKGETSGTSAVVERGQEWYVDVQNSGSVKAEATLICYYFKRPKQ